MKQLGFLDFDTRLQRIDKAGDPLSKLNTTVDVDQRAIMTHLAQKQRPKLTPLCYPLRGNLITEELEDVDSGDNSEDPSILFCRRQGDQGDQPYAKRVQEHGAQGYPQ
jgi:hypothetical protein